jgi:hypothetical protein
LVGLGEELEDSVVFAVDGDDGCVVEACGFEEMFSGADETFFVGKGEYGRGGEEFGEYGEGVIES